MFSVITPCYGKKKKKSSRVLVLESFRPSFLSFVYPISFPLSQTPLRLVGPSLVAVAVWHVGAHMPYFLQNWSEARLVFPVSISSRGVSVPKLLTARLKGSERRSLLLKDAQHMHITRLCCSAFGPVGKENASFVFSAGSEP